MSEAVPTKITSTSSTHPCQNISVIDTPSTPQKRLRPLRSPKKVALETTNSNEVHRTFNSPSKSPRLIRRLQQSNAVTVTPDSIWYETYTLVEPLPEGVQTERDVNVVKTEFEHILSNVYVNKPKSKRKTVIFLEFSFLVCRMIA